MSDTAIPSESWENVYSGFDRRDGYLGWVMASVKAHLPAPEISPTCKKNGHKWRQVPSLFPRRHFSHARSECYGCERCAKRGLVVLRTDGFESRVAEREEMSA